MEIYVVTDDHYEDYHVLGVFTERDAAEQLALTAAYDEGTLYHASVNIEIWSANEPQLPHAQDAYDIVARVWRDDPFMAQVHL